MFKDMEKLLLRGAVGGIMAAHGAQKLFGAFDGPGMEGTTGMVARMGLQPARAWATAAAGSEFGGGVLTALGLGGPLGQIAILASMAMATGKAHWGKPIFTSAGGAELPVIYSAAALTIASLGPGRYSLDELFGIRVPGIITALATIGAGAAVGYGIMQAPEPAPPTKDTLRTTLQGGEDAISADAGANTGSTPAH